MSRPITWQTLAAPDLRGVAQMMGQAQNSFNSGFGNLNDVLKQREATETANWNQQKTNNTNELFNKLAGYKTPEEYQAALDSGALQQEAAGYGAQVDQAAFRKALDARMGDLQQRAVQGINYQTALDNEADVTKSGAATEAMGKGEYTQAGELIKGMSPRNQAAWFQKLEAQKDSDTKQAQQDVKVGFDLQDQAYKEKTRPIQEDILREQLAHSKAQTAEIGAKPLVAAAKAQREQAEADLKNYHKNDMYGSERFSRDPSVNAGHIYDTVAKVLGKDGDKASVALSTYFADPKNAEYVQKKADGSELRLPHNAAVIKQAMAMTESGFKKGTFFGIGSDAGYGDEYVKQVIANVDKIMAESTKDINTPGAMNSYARLESLSNAARGDVVAPSGNATGLPKPAAEKPTSNAPSTALDKAAEKAGVTKPKEAPELAKAGAALLDVATILPSAGFSAITGAVNATGILPNQLPVPLMDKGYVPFSDALAKNPEMVTPPAMSFGKSSAFGATGALPAETIERNKATLREQLNPTPAGYNDRVAAIAALDKAVEKKPAPVPAEPTKKYPWSASQNQGTKVRIKKVKDGDTVEFESLDGTPVPNAIGNVGRFGSTDANETGKPQFGIPGQRFADEAKQFLAEMTDGKEVTVRVSGQATRSDTDKTRNLIDIDVDGVPLEIAMVRGGYTRTYSKYLPEGSQRRIDLEHAEKLARTERKGVYSKEMRSELTPEERRIEDRKKLLNR